MSFQNFNVIVAIQGLKRFSKVALQRVTIARKLFVSLMALINFLGRAIFAAIVHRTVRVVILNLIA